MRKAASPRTVRCAIYTRKSTDEGLEQDFNSLDAQREACAAYILSQRHEGWTLVPDLYDDGGYSGGNMDRPALKALLAEVAAGRVDVIVVYKVDRLTRSLADFARIVDVLDAGDASFVSVTQSFNTTTSMGRLTLNVLLSFAQFEREVTGERIRDKIAASKAKGMWMGGPVPLGYDLVDRKLVINDAEAGIVRRIFERYVALGSGRALVAELEIQGVRSKPRVNRHGRAYGNQPISRGGLYAILRNRLYVGDVHHKGQTYPGQHEAIVDRELFDAVQRQLADAVADRRHGCNAREPSLLSGLMRDGHGRLLSPSHAVRQGKRYRYYVSQRDGEIASSQPCWRMGAHEIEALVRARVEEAIDALVRERIAVGDLDADSIGTLQAAATNLREQLGDQRPAVVREALLSFVRRIDVTEGHVTIAIDPTAIHAALDTDEHIVTASIGFVRAGRQVRLLLPPVDPDADRPRNPALLKVIAQAFIARRTIETGLSLDAAASQLGYGREYLTDLVRVAYLSPRIIEAILDGTQPSSLSRRRLLQASSIPLDWPGQERMFGFG